MKKIALSLFLSLVALTSFGQWQQVGNSLQRTADGLKYRTNLGSPGFAYWYTQAQIDSLFGAGGGYFRISNNLSESTNLPLLRTHIGLGLGSQPTFAGLTLTGGLNGTYGIFTNNVAGSSIIASGGTAPELLTYANGSNTANGGPSLVIGNAAQNRNWQLQLDASNNLQWFYYGGSGWTSYYTISPTGLTAPSFVKSGATAGNYLKAGGGDDSPATVLSTIGAAPNLLTGYVSGAGTVSAADNVLQGIQKINGNEVVDAANIATNTTNIASNTTAIATKASALIPTAIKTANYTAAVNDFVQANTTSGDVVITLPTTPANGSLVGVKHLIQGSYNVVYIVAGGTDVINNLAVGASNTLSRYNQSVIFQYKSGVWISISNDVYHFIGLNRPEDYTSTGLGSEAFPYISSDGTGGIQTSITNLSRGGKVELGSFRYNLSAPVIINTFGIHLQGVANGFSVNATQNQSLTGSTTIQSDSLGIQLGAYGSGRISGISLEDLYLWGPGVTGSSKGIALKSAVDQPHFRNFYVGNENYGMYFDAVPDAGLIESSSFHRNGYGIYFTPHSIVGYTKMIGDEIADNYKNGITITASTADTINGKWARITESTIVRSVNDTTANGANISLGNNEDIVALNAIRDAGHNTLGGGGYHPADGVRLDGNYHIVGLNNITDNTQGSGINVNGTNNLISGNIFRGNNVDITLGASSAYNVIFQPNTTNIVDNGTKNWVFARSATGTYLSLAYNGKNYFETKNTVAGTGSESGFKATSDGGYAVFGKYSTTTSAYKNISSGDAEIYSSTGNIDLLADVGGLNITVGGDNVNKYFSMPAAGGVSIKTPGNFSYTGVGSGTQANSLAYFNATSGFGGVAFNAVSGQGTGIEFDEATVIKGSLQWASNNAVYLQTAKDFKLTNVGASSTYIDVIGSSGLVCIGCTTDPGSNNKFAVNGISYFSSFVTMAQLTASKVVFTDGSKNLTSTGIGTSAQFIKGDGSLDGTTYAPLASPTFTGTVTMPTTNFNAGLNLKGGFGSSYYNTANTFSSNVSVNTLTGNQTLTIPDATGTIVTSPNGTTAILASNQTTLVAGTIAISITGVTTGSHAQVTSVSQGGTVVAGYYEAVCTSGTLTITAKNASNVTNTLDTSTLSYLITN